MSDTPLTDAALARSGGLLDMCEHARSIERENQALREAIDEALINLAEQAPHSAEARLRAALKKATK